MKKSGMIEKELFVYVGRDSRVPVRLILQLVPEEVYEKRIRDKTRKSKGQGRGELTEETKTRSRFTIFITNAEESKLSAKQVYPLYRIRWQIELQFKIWKSVFNITSCKEVKGHRYMTQLYIKLLLIIINLQITYSLQHAFVLKSRFSA
jgi:transposase